MNFACVIVYIFLLLEILYLSIAIVASKIPYFRNRRRRLAQSLTASRLAAWVHLITRVMVGLLVFPTFFMSFGAVASLRPFDHRIDGKSY